MSLQKPSKKKPRLLPNLDQLHSQRYSDKAITATIKDAVDRLKGTPNVTSLERLRGLDADNILVWLITKYGSPTILALMKALESLPTSLTKCQRYTLLRQVCTVQPSDIELDNICSLLSAFCSNAISIFGRKSTLQHVLAPPVQTCLECSANLVAYHTCNAKYYSCNNAYNVKKYTLRCVKCNLLYNYSQYGDKHQKGFRYYSQERPAVEVTDTVYFDRLLLEWQCSLANHSWVSFQGFCESFNTALQLPPELELTPKIISKAFWVGEVENEIRKMEKSDYVFKSDADLENCMDMIEEERQMCIYPHPDNDCTPECKERGCGKLWVTDGIWSLNYSHCMYQVKHCIQGFPTVNLPDVCTNSPMYGQAFCKDHCDFLSQSAPDVPLTLRNFLEYCKAIKPDDDIDNCDSDLVEAVVNEVLPTSVNLGTSAAISQGTMPLLSANPGLVDAVKVVGDGPICRKDTGKGHKLRKWSRGHQFIVRSGGHIEMWAPLYKSESPSQVFLLLIQWLVAAVSAGVNTDEMFLAYDNMCHLATMKAASRPIPLPPPLNDVWQSVTKIIDSFHLPNHRNKSCKEVFSPEPMKKKYPHFNTQVGEQTFTWLHNFSKILSSMPKRHHLFYLHRMVIRRNQYTSRCYVNGRKPILPKK